MSEMRMQPVRMQQVTSALLVLTFALGACSAGGASGTGNGSTQAAAGAADAAASQPQPSGPFRAVATSAISVDLSWDPVDGATGYRIENQFGDSEWFTLASLDSAQTSFEDFLTPENQQLTYRLTPLLGDHEGKALTTQVATPASVPNPYTVVATLEEPDYGSVSLDIPGFDPSTFDPSTFDPSTLDLSGINPENLDMSSLLPEPVSAVATIGPAGGTLSVTGANGVIYTLDVPEGALLFDAPIVMTPVKDIQGYPFTGGYFGAVELRPQGINFEIPATLTIQLSDEVDAARDPSPDLVEVAFAFQGSGEEFHLTPRSLDGAASSFSPAHPTGKMAQPSQGRSRMFTVPVRQAKTVGAGSAKRGQPRQQAENHPTTSAASNTDQKAAASQIDDELAPLTPVSEEQQKAAEQAFYRSYSEVQAALRDANTARDLDAALYRFEKEIYDKGRYDSYLQDVDRQLLWDTAIAAVMRNLDLVDCPSDEAAAIQKLARRLQHPGTDFEAELARRFKEVHGDDGQKRLDAIAALKSCLVKLILESPSALDDEICRVEFKVRTEVPLNWDYDKGGYLQGAAPIVYADAGKLHASNGFNPDNTDCLDVKIANLNSANFVVLRLMPQMANGAVYDWKLEWADAGEATEICRTLLLKDEDPPRKETVCEPLPGGAEKDLWGGLATLVEFRSGVGIGKKDWTLDFNPDHADQATWKYPGGPIKASGDGFRLEHTTTLKITAR
jgi:hypothetical protein